MTNTQGKHGNHFSLEPLVHESAPRGSIHLSTDTKRVALVLILAVASFLTVYFLSGSGDDVKTQLRFADDGSGTPAPTAEATATPMPAATPPGSLAYNGFPDLSGNGNANGIASTVIRNSAASNVNGLMGTNGNANGSSTPNGNMNGTFGMNANANGVVPTSGNVGMPSALPSSSPLPTSVYPTPTPLTTALGQYGVVGYAGEQMAPTPTPTPSATPTPIPTPSSSPTPTAEPIKRGMEPSGPAAWMALLPVLMVGIFRFARKSV